MTPRSVETKGALRVMAVLPSSLTFLTAALAVAMVTTTLDMLPMTARLHRLQRLASVLVENGGRTPPQTLQEKGLGEWNARAHLPSRPSVALTPYTPTLTFFLSLS